MDYVLYLGIAGATQSTGPSERGLQLDPLAWLTWHLFLSVQACTSTCQNRINKNEQFTSHGSIFEFACYRLCYIVWLYHHPGHWRCWLKDEQINKCVSVVSHCLLLVCFTVAASALAIAQIIVYPSLHSLNSSLAEL